MRPLLATLLVTASVLGAGCTLDVAPPFTGGGGAVAPSMSPEKSAFGTVRAVESAGNDTFTLTLDALAVDCQRNATTWNATGRVAPETDLPREGETAGAWLTDTSSPGGSADWVIGQVFADAAAYAEACRPRHEQDVTVGGAPRTEDPSGDGSTRHAVSIELTPVLIGATTPVTVNVRNAQDVPLDVTLSNVTLVNEEAYTASGNTRTEEERVNASRVSGCRATPEVNALTVQPDARTAVIVHIACDADAEPRPEYERCEKAHWEPGPSGGEAREVPGGCERVRAQRPTATLVGHVAFTDELGARHEALQSFRQFLHVGHAATLEVDAPEEVPNRDAFVVEAWYVDADGNAIRNAALSLHLDYPGLEDRRFTMRFDAERGAHVFTWDDMQEWKPWRWHEGDHEVTVRARPAMDAEFVPRTTSLTVTFT